MSDDIEVLAPFEASVAIGGRTLTVRPIRAGRVPEVTKHFQGLMSAVMQLMKFIPDEGSSDGSDKVDFSMGELDEVIGILSEHGHRLFPALAALTEVPETEIREADLGEFAELLLKAIGVNKRFFDQKLVPMAKAALAEIKAPTSSRSSTS